MRVDTAVALINWEINDETEFFKEVVEETVFKTGRWNKYLEKVYKDGRDGTFWKITWSEGLTEYQDQSPEIIRAYEVYPKEISKTIYVRKEA